MKVQQMLDTTTAADFKSDPGINSEPITKDPIADDRQRTLLCASQDKIEFSLNENGDAIITQSHWPDEDQVILVSRTNIPEFIDRLTDAIGIPSIGGPAR
jgi:hypothetical protein